MGDASRLLALSAVPLFAGAVLVLTELRWFRRPSLVQRLGPHVPGTGARATRGGLLSVSSFRDVLGPAARELGERLSQLLGVGDDLASRLARARLDIDPSEFRLHQFGRSGLGLIGGAMLAAIAGSPPAITVLFVLGGPVLAFLLVEQQLSSRCTRRQRHLTLELPVVSEQLGMLLGAGYSLGGALNRLATRGSGACAEDLTRVCGRIRQGLSEVEALREWAAVVQVDAVSRLVGVLALNRDAGDLGRLISEEARSIRREVQRELLEEIERKAQQVWIPVTVATLVPGSIVLAVPFMDALRLFSSA